MTTPLVSDTAHAAARVQIELLRAAGPARRAALTGSLSHTAIALSRNALRTRMAGGSERDVLLRWVALSYGEDLSRPSRPRPGRGGLFAEILRSPPEMVPAV